LGSVEWMAVARKVLKFSDLTDLGDIDPLFKGVTLNDLKMEKGDVEKEKYLNANIPECDIDCVVVPPQEEENVSSDDSVNNTIPSSDDDDEEHDKGCWCFYGGRLPVNPMFREKPKDQPVPLKEVEDWKVGDFKIMEREEGQTLAKVVIITPWWVILTHEEKVKFLKYPEYILLRNYIDSGGDENELDWCSFRYIVQRIKYPEKPVANKAAFKAAMKKWKLLRWEYDFGRFFESRDTVRLAKKMIELDVLDK